MRRALIAILVVVAYAVSGKLGLALALTQQNVTPVWPPSGIALAAVLLLGARFWPAILAGAFWVNYASELPALMALGIGVGNTLEALLAYAILKRVFRFHNDVARLRDVLALVFVGAILSPLVAALVGAGSLLASGAIPTALFLPVLGTWWLGDGVGILIVTPLILVWASRGVSLPRGWRALELILLGLILLAGSLYFMRGGFTSAYALFPILIWAAYRFRQRGAVTAVAIVSTISVIYTLQVTTLGPGDLAVKLFEFQSFIGITAITMMMLAAAITEGEKAEEERLKLAGLQVAETQSQASRKRISFLSNASKTLASSLHYRTTLQNVARLAVPELADICIIDIQEATNGIMHRIAAVDGDPELERKIELLGHRPRSISPISETMKTGSVYLVAQVGDELIKAISTSPEHEAFLRSIAPRSVMALPMIVRGRPLGVMVLVTAASQRTFGEEDRILAVELGYRVTMAIENALLYEESQKAVAMRDEFLSVAAHELKTPVTGILGFSQLLLRQLNQGLGDPAILRQGLEAIDRQSGKLAKLIAQLLDVSRIEAGRLALDRWETDIGELVLAAVQAAKPLALHISFVTDIAPDVRAFVDPIRIEQVITNLLGNAIKYSPPEGLIELSVSFQGDVVRIVVRDHGAGILPAALPFVFDRFYQANANSYIAGMGLGLYISREIVELHKGGITAETPIDGGTRITVSLPVSTEGAS